MTQDTDLAKKMRTLKRALEHIPVHDDASSEIVQAAANELLLIEVELSYSRTFIREVRRLLEPIGKGVAIDRKV